MQSQQKKTNWDIEYPELRLIKNISWLSNIKSFQEKIEKFEIHDEQTPNISFHYHSDGSQAIIFNKFCNREIVKKVLSQPQDFDFLYYDLDAPNVLLIKNGNISQDKLDELSHNMQSQQKKPNWDIEYPELRLIKNISWLSNIKSLIEKFEIHDEQTPDISFHYHSDGSQAIIFNKFCNREIVKKVLSQPQDFDFLYYDLDAPNVLLIKNGNIYQDKLDELSQQYINNSIPLTTYLSIKFEEQKKHLNKLGIYKKKNLYQMKTIPNERLRIDLIEMNECLDNDLEFDDQYQDQYCYAIILKGLIVGPQDTLYEGIVCSLTIKIPEKYPDVPPDVSFNQNILHPNISEKGIICLDILNKKWSPALTIQKVLISIVSLLFERNLDDVYNQYAKYLYIQNPLKLKQKINEQIIFSGSKKIDINYKEIQRLSTIKKKNNQMQDSDGDDDEFEDAYQDMLKDDDCNQEYDE